MDQHHIQLQPGKEVEKIRVILQQILSQNYVALTFWQDSWFVSPARGRFRDNLKINLTLSVISRDLSYPNSRWRKFEDGLIAQNMLRVFMFGHICKYQRFKNSFCDKNKCKKKSYAQHLLSMTRNNFNYNYSRLDKVVLSLGNVTKALQNTSVS